MAGTMGTSKKLVFALILTAFLGFLPLASASAEEGRYFVKSTKGFWKNALSARNSFDNGFTADMSDFQVRFAKIWGLDIEPVKVLQILPASPTHLPDGQDGQAGEPEDKLSVGELKEELTPTPAVPAQNKPSAKGGKTARQVPSDQTPWGVETIYNDPIITKASGGDNVKVAVLDTGVLVSHPDLKNRIAQCKDFTAARFPIIDGKCDDKNGHGTHVAGIIAADAGSDGKGIYGVAPAAQLFVYKVCGANGLCYADDIAVALRLAADQGANIANMSFGSDSESGLIRDAVNYAGSKGVLPIAAAGNDGPFAASIDYPGAQAETVAVGALNQNKDVTEWSSRGINTTTLPYVVEEKDIEFAAPGENIESTWNNGGYVILSGTSMASPFVAGLAAKYWQAAAINPAQATRGFLHDLALDLLPVGDDNSSGFGLPKVIQSN